MLHDVELSEEQVREVVRCMMSPEYFIENFCWLEQKASAGVSESSSIIPFYMGSRPATKEEKDWTRVPRDTCSVPEEAQFYFQRQILRWCIAKENILADKSRRVGCSWIAAGYAAWLINFHKGVNVVFISRTGRDAKKILHKVKFILKNLAYHDSDDLRLATKAAWLRNHIEVDTQEEFSIGFRNDEGEVTILSTAQSITNTDDAARGDDVTFLVFDELAFYEHPDETWASAKKALARGGHWMAISTRNGIGDVYHRLVSMAELSGLGKLEEKLEFKYTGFIHWTEAGMTRAQVERASVGDTQDLRDQEWEGKWIVPGSAVFDPTHLAACYKPLNEHPELAEYLAEYRLKVLEGKGLYMYFSGIDTIIGRSNRKSKEKDWNSFNVLTSDNIQAFHYYDQSNISKWAGKTIDNVQGGRVELVGKTSQLHTEYPGIVYIEEEGPGLTVWNNHQLPKDVFSHKHAVQMKSLMKRDIITRLQLKIEHHSIVITCPWTYQCLMVFQHGSAPGQYEAPPGFNDDCLLAGTLVKTSRGYIPIEDINPGDLVLTHEGRYQPVELSLKKPFDGDFYKMKFQGQLPLHLSYNHPLYCASHKYSGRDVVGRFSKRSWVFPENWSKSYKQVSIIENLKSLPDFVFSEADFYKKENGNNDARINKVIGDKDFARFLGLFLAEGTCNHAQIYSMSIGLNSKKEEGLVKWVTEYLQSIGIPVRVYERKSNCTSVEFNGKLLFYMMAACYGKNKEKILPWYAFELGDKLRYVLEYWLKGDGWRHRRKGMSTNLIVGATTSKQLALSMRDIALSTDRCATVQRIKRHRYGVETKDQYRVLVQDEWSDTSHLRRLSKFECGSRISGIDSESKIEKYHYQGHVYNLQVANDRSFVADGIVVHNCVMSLAMSSDAVDQHNKLSFSFGVANRVESASPVLHPYQNEREVLRSGPMLQMDVAQANQRSVDGVLAQLPGLPTGHLSAQHAALRFLIEEEGEGRDRYG